MIYCFDLDGTLCTLTGGVYQDARPFENRIKHVNKLFGQGHTIKIFTARGATSRKSWRELTEKQLVAWGIQHDELIMGKPGADVYIDDKALNAEVYEWV